jgi:hypothetical protein
VVVHAAPIQHAVIAIQQRARRRCVVCLAPLAARATGRPARYCGDACRQKAFRRVTKLRAEPPAVALLREHGLEGEALFEFVDLILAEVLRRHGATLWDARREDLRGYLPIVCCCAVRPRYVFGQAP